MKTKTQKQNSQQPQTAFTVTLTQAQHDALFAFPNAKGGSTLDSRINHAIGIYNGYIRRGADREATKGASTVKAQEQANEIEALKAQIAALTSKRKR